MLLIGQFDSPYVRRVGIALKLYGIAFEHRPYSVFRDAEKIAPYNPLRKVPTLVLDDGTALMETFVCLDVIDEDVAAKGAPRLLLPRSGPLRREGLRIGALCSGTCEKLVSLVYDRELHNKQSSAFWVERCRTQIHDTLLTLEVACARRVGLFVLDEQLSHADIALTCTFTFAEETGVFDVHALELPAMKELARRCEALPEFASVKQPFFVPR